ncbi:MAG: hypothetical protein MI806_09830 [Minwuiales bacterium]|nr:hypothetical protein [Minwuiales bacterium]
MLLYSEEDIHRLDEAGAQGDPITDRRDSSDIDLALINAYIARGRRLRSEVMVVHAAMVGRLFARAFAGLFGPRRDEPAAKAQAEA